MNTHTTPSKSPVAVAAMLCMAALLMAGCNQSSTESNTPTTTTVGTQVDDAVITSSVKAALLGDPSIKSLDFQVETRKGTVQLSGFVDDQRQIDQAMMLASGVPGVANVENGLTVKSAPATLGSGIDDTTVTTRVKAALLEDPGIKSLDISVVTSHGEVQLTGFVGKKAQILAAENIARAVPGVSGIKNELMLKK